MFLYFDRRLRNRESARRVRARRLAEMSHMETAVHGMQDENVTLKAHVSKLQAHIQSMTMKVYEITAKYESAVAENAQLRTELHRLRRVSFRALPACGVNALLFSARCLRVTHLTLDFRCVRGKPDQPSWGTRTS